MMKTYQFGIIGSGEMAHAILEGALASGLLQAEDVICSSRTEASLEKMKKLGVKTTLNNQEVAKSSKFLMVGVRPQDFPVMAESVYGLAENVISIMAGIKAGKIKTLMGAKRVCRVMPNLPCRIGYGMCGVDTSEFNEAESKFLLDVFGAKGKAIAVSEDKLEAVTGISGSGPAYVYLFLKCLTNAGIEQGLTENEARMLAVQTVIGGAKMVECSDKSFDELIASVCSKGGTTIRAIESFVADDMQGSVSKAVNACVERAKELSK